MKAIAMQFALAVVIACSIGCNSGTNQPTVVTPAQGTANAKRYHLTGKVVSVDKQAHMLNVDGDDIPGFMAAMTMPYKVRPESEIDKLSPGNPISADVVVQGASSWLENIAVTKSGPPTQK